MRLKSALPLLAALMIAAPHGAFAKVDEPKQEQGIHKKETFGPFQDAPAPEPKQEDAQKEPPKAPLPTSTNVEIHAQPEEPPVRNVALTPAQEGAGPWDTPGEGNLGLDLWHDTARESAVDLFAGMPAASSSAGVQKLIFGMLLGSADLSMLKDADAPAKPGQDFLTLRLEKMLEAGAYKQAMDLYSSLGLDAPPESVAKAGILAMFYSGEKSLGCLELNTEKDRFAAVDFFKTVAAYCDATLSGAPDPASLDALKASPDKALLSLATQKDFSVTYTPAAFAKYSPLEKAALAAEGKLRLAANTNLRTLPATDLQIVKKFPGLTPKDVFILNTRAVETGLMTPDEFKKFLLSTIDLDIRKDPALAVPDNLDDWQKLPYQLQIAMNKTEAADKWPFIKAALPAGRVYGAAALRPFADLIYKSTPDAALNLADADTAVRVMNAGGYNIPPQWADFIKDYSPKAGEKDRYAGLLAAVILSERDGKDSEIVKKLKGFAGDGASKKVISVNNIIENLDSNTPPEHTADGIYENQLDLTLQADYVMPSKELWNHLLQAGKAGHIGETVLLSTAAFGEAPLNTIHPAFLRDALMSIKSVGLTDISDELAIEAVLGEQDN